MNWLFRLLSSVAIAFRSVVRNKLRASLTIVGITIGIAAVVTMTALGTAARAQIGGQIASLGSNALIVFPQSSRSSGAKTTTGSKLSEGDCQALERESTSIRAAVPFLRSSAQAVYEGKNVKVEVIGSRSTYLDVRNWNVTRGEGWTPSSENVSEKVVLIGANTSKELFGTANPVDRTIRIGKYPYRIIGVLEEKGPSPFGQSQDDVVVMPITTMRSHVRFARPGETDAIFMSATAAETTERAKKQAESILRQRHRIQEGEEDDFIIRSQAEIKELQESITGSLSTLLIGIAAVSLIVGGIGVMNIMLVSVTERTREIGIRMAIGAREADILTQFLIEALVLTTIGGLTGTAIAYGATIAIGKFAALPMEISPTALVVALVVSSSIGLVFGFVPAFQAAKLDPVQALGRE
ncbi:MAG: ABC transporter permease [Polyangiaceae bacterium]|nr:ABC transporter permease [Polyangiaceae bacterium]